jgi:hypothetical protein
MLRAFIHDSLTKNLLIYFNVKLSSLIEIERGIKQGDPLSMLLYIVIARFVVFE